MLRLSGIDIKMFVNLHEKISNIIMDTVTV